MKLRDETPWEEHSRFSLIEGMLIAQQMLESEGSSNVAQQRLVTLCRDLGLWLPQEAIPVRHSWEVCCRPVHQLHTLPDKAPHAGLYDWIGQENKASAKWLWDSETSQTVEATEERLCEGYMAVSYTWRR